jgi:uncharacterized protein
MGERPPPRLLVKLGELQAARPWLFVVIALLSLIPAAFAAAGLGFKADFAELLPDNKPSVIEMRRVADRLPGASTLTVVAQIEDTLHRRSLERFVDALVPKLKAMGPEWVGAVDYGVQDARRFFDQNKLLYADLADLKQAHQEVLDRYDYEVGKAQGTLIDEEDAPPPITAESVKQRLAGKAGTKKDPTADQYPNGYYESQDGKFIAVLVRTPVSGKARTEEFRRRVEDAVAALDPRSFDPSMEVHYTGDIITSAEEYDAVVRDLGEVGVTGVVGVLVALLLFFLRIRAVLTLGATMLIGLIWSFGFTRFTIGYLNSSTGFLVSIIAGNGINYGIMYMARYIEARRDENATVERAIAIAHRDSWLATIASSATAALAYGSLVVTDFRGFKHFGIIGAYAMLLCWASTYLFMPAILAASERVLPAYKQRDPNARRSRARGYYGILFAQLSIRAPRLVALAGVAIGIASVVLSALYLKGDPLEYDMANVRNERRDKTAAGVLSQRVDAIVGRIGQDGMAIMTDRVDQVPLLETELMKRYDAAPADLKPFEKVVTIFTLLPKQVEEKIPLIEEMRDRVLRARKRGFISDQDWAELEPQIPKGKIHPITIASLPEQVARAFTERDGTRGRIVYIAPKSGFSVWDAKYLMRWADSFRTTKLPNGEVIEGSGRAVIFADMIITVREDMPKAIAVSSLGTIIVIIFAFRGSPMALGVFAPWLMGISSMLAFLYLKQIHLNFLNFVAIPITIGIGAEYAHNLMQRYRIEGDERIYQVVAETGGAVTLCSLTTTVGYLALLISINRGTRSFGLAAAVGELTCLLAAVLVLPAFLAWRMRRRAWQYRAAIAAGTKAVPPPSSRGARRGDR